MYLNTAQFEVRSEHVTVVTTDGYRISATRYSTGAAHASVGEGENFNVTVLAKDLRKALRAAGLALIISPASVNVQGRVVLSYAAEKPFPTWENMLPKTGQAEDCKAYFNLAYAKQFLDWRYPDTRCVGQPSTSLLSPCIQAHEGAKCVWVWSEPGVRMVHVLMPVRLPRGKSETSKNMEEWYR